VVHLVKPPDLTIYLKASISKLVDQIAARNREYEDSIRIDYLRKLNERYDQWFEHYTLGKKLEIEVDTLDFVNSPEHLGTILRRVNAELFGLFK
jgi:deoxyadenosine/deoxycytidine kinase